MRLRVSLVGLAVLLASACGEPPPLAVLVQPEHRALVDDFFQYVPFEDLSIVETDRPVDRLAATSGTRVAVLFDLQCDGCDASAYRIDGTNGRFAIHAAGALGAQYGLAEVLEAGGYRFFHPWRSHVPEQFARALPLEHLGEVQKPDVATRGLHLHTLHPIEGYFDFWEPSPENLEGARRNIDWLVKNRGNYLQYPALDNITNDAAQAEAWRAHTQQIIDYAHRRGVRMGVGVQLFGESNLQQAFDLIDVGVTDARAEMERRLNVLLRDLPFDEVSLSFGEFSGADPAEFVAKVNLAYQVMQEVSPGVTVNAVIHVGNSPELKVTYEGETLLYYFLVKYADAHLKPYVHSVMYFDLFEDAGGAYLHDEFSDHRAYLLQRMADQEPVAYFPESAYWIAFDNTLPTYLPLYVRSRFVDLKGIRQAAGRSVPEHTLFSSGWEWGYWQNDYATLRMTWRQPDTWHQPLDEAFAAYGDKGRVVAAAIAKVGEAQHALITKRLAAYVAGRDQLIDAGKTLGIVSQPDRVQFDEVAAFDNKGRLSFKLNVVDPLAEMADAHEAALKSVEAQDLGDDPFLNEVRDGLAVTLHRLRFVHALYSAALAYSETQTDGGFVDKALAELEAAKAVVQRRDANLHDPDGRALLRNGPNHTFYQYGYLRDAASLCLWNRERVQVQQLIFGSTELVPGCVL